MRACACTIAAITNAPRRPLDSDRPDEENDVEAWRLFLLAHAAAVRAIEQDVQRVGIPLTWYDVLLELNAVPGGQLRMQELSDRVVLSRTRVSRVVDEMALHQLVRKRRDDEDRRSTWAVITREGRAQFHKTVPHYMAGIRKHFNQHITTAERTALVRALGKVVEAHSGPSRRLPLPGAGKS